MMSPPDPNKYLIPLLLYFLKGILSIDVFCGNLTVYEQQRFGSNSFLISSQATDDLKQCLEICCNIPNCRGVSLLGIINPLPGEPNCQLIGCRGGDCLLNARGDFQDGLLSVVLHRDTSEQSQEIVSNIPGSDGEMTDTTGRLIFHAIHATKATTTTTMSSSGNYSSNDDNNPSMLNVTMSPEVSSTDPHDNNKQLSNALQPVWAVGLAIVVAVCCVGLSLGLLSAYICYRRQKNRKQRAEIAQPKMPTLHAFTTAY